MVAEFRLDTLQPFMYVLAVIATYYYLWRCVAGKDKELLAIDERLKVVYLSGRDDVFPVHTHVMTWVEHFLKRSKRLIMLV